MRFHYSLKIVGDQVAHRGPKSCFQLPQESLSRCLHDSEQFSEAGIQVLPHHLVYSSKLGHEKLCQDPVYLPHCPCIVDCLKMEGPYFLHCFLHFLTVLCQEFLIVGRGPTYRGDGKYYIPILGLQGYVPHQTFQRSLSGD